MKTLAARTVAALALRRPALGTPCARLHGHDEEAPA